MEVEPPFFLHYHNHPEVAALGHNITLNSGSHIATQILTKRKITTQISQAQIIL